MQDLEIAYQTFANDLANAYQAHELVTLEDLKDREGALLFRAAESLGIETAEEDGEDYTADQLAHLIESFFSARRYDWLASQA